MGSPPSSAHPCAVTKWSEDVWMHLRAWTTSQPPVYLSPCSRLSQMFDNFEIISYNYLSGMWVCGSGKRLGSLKWDIWINMMLWYSLNNDVDSNCDDFLYLKWTDGLRSRWVPAGTSYPESTKSCVLGIIEDILSFIWYHSPVLKDTAVNKSSYFPFIKKTFNIKIHCPPLQCRTCSQ